MAVTKRFSEEFNDFKEELQGYYATYPILVPDVEARISQLNMLNPKATCYEKKAFIYQAAAELCKVHLFRHCSLFYEMQAGRCRNGLTKGFPPEPGIGGWLMRQNNYMEKEFEDWHEVYDDQLVMISLFFTDFSHYAVAADNIFAEGLGGMRLRAQQKLFCAESKKERGFLNAVITGLNAVITISHKFGDEAKRMLETETDATVIKRLKRIADAAYRVPEHPPASFFEALNTIWLMKEITITMEGIGQAVLGHIDRLLYPYYEADLKRGKITPEEAKDLLAEFLAITDSKWDIYDDIAMGGVNTTVVVGGCDSAGEVIFNDITRMIFEIYDEYSLIDPKLQVRVSGKHPEEYFDIIAHTAAKGLNIMSIFNDDVMIPAHVKMGKSLEDSRLYVAGGCQEPVLSNTEINVRAICYINLPKIINDTIDVSQNNYWEREKLKPCSGADATTYEEFYDCVMNNMGKMFESLVNNYNRLQSEWTEYSPCPLYSATITGCIENAKDMTEGGAKYNYNSLSPVGIGTFIDALYAIKTVVFDNKMITLKELLAILEKDFEGHEDIRQHLLNSVEKFGNDDEVLNQFAAKISEDIARLSSGMPNSRGGIYEPSLFSNLGYLFLRDYEATADGRKKGEILSRGISPSDQSGAEVISKILRGIKPIDMSNYPAGAVLYLDMPYSQVTAL